MNFLERFRAALVFRPVIRIGRELARLNDNFESFLYHSKMPTGAQHKLLLAEADAAEKESIAARARNILNITAPEDREQSELDLAIVQAREIAKHGGQLDQERLSAIIQAQQDLADFDDANPRDKPRKEY